MAAYNNLGSRYCSLCKYDKAIMHLETSLTIAIQIGHKKGKETACGKLGSCYFYLRQYIRAIEYLEMYLAIRKVIGHGEGEIAAYYCVGACYISILVSTTRLYEAS